MTRTSKIWLVLSFGMVCMAFFAVQSPQTVWAQSTADSLDLEAQERTKSSPGLLPVLDLQSLPSFKAMQGSADETPHSLLSVMPDIFIEEEKEQPRFIFDTNDSESAKGCQGTDPKGEFDCPLAGCPDSTCPHCEACPVDRELVMPESVSPTLPHEASWAVATLFDEQPQPNPYFHKETENQCGEIADSLAKSLADSNISTESRQEILAATMKLLVRNAELEARAEVAMLKLQHEREMAQLRSEVAEHQTYASQIGEIKNWMGPIYANQNQTQRQFQGLMTNLQLINRTLRLLEQEKQTQQLHLTQPAPVNNYPPQIESNPFVRPDRPERWSRLPSHEQPQNVPRRPDHSTMKDQEPAPTIFRASTPVLAPKRLSPQEVQQQRLQSEIRQMQTQLERLQNRSNVRQANWNEPLPSNPLKPLPQMLRPLKSN